MDELMQFSEIIPLEASSQVLCHVITHCIGCIELIKLYCNDCIVMIVLYWLDCID